MMFVKIDADHASVDDSYVLVQDDGTKTNICIQDSTEYNEGYAVQIEGFDDPEDEDSWFIQVISTHRTLVAAKKAALKAFTNL